MASATGAGGLSVGVTPVTYSGDCVNVTAGGCTASAIYAGDVNHYPSPTGQASIMITPATPTITVTGGNYAYDGNPHPATGVAKGINNLMVPGTFGFAYTPGGASVPTIPRHWERSRLRVPTTRAVVQEALQSTSVMAFARPALAEWFCRHSIAMGAVCIHGRVEARFP